MFEQVGVLLPVPHLNFIDRYGSEWGLVIHNFPLIQQNSKHKKTTLRTSLVRDHSASLTKQDLQKQN